MYSPSVLITGCIHKPGGGRETRDAYSACILDGGGIPALADGLCGDAATRFDALLLTGGYDVDPRRFGEERLYDTINLCPERDSYEFALLDEFVRAGRPVLGICRGIQVVNVYFGGSLWQDLPAQQGLCHYGTTHPVYAVSGSFVDGLFGGEFAVNSSHHQAIKTTGSGLSVVCRAPDGTVEAVSHASLPVWGVQWHPELLPEYAPLFEWFVRRVKTS